MKNKIILSILITNLIAVITMIVDIVFLDKFIINTLDELIIVLALILLIIINGILLVMFDKDFEKEKRQQQFVTNSVHSLRTPISVINGNIELLKCEFSEEFVNNISNESKKLEKLTTNLMNYAILEEVGYLKPEIINASEIIYNECVEAQALFKTHHIFFDYNISQNISWLGSKQRVSVMFNTLIENAAKYTTGKVQCNLTSDYLEIINKTNSKDGNYSFLFNRFKRDNETKNGFGVGMSVVKTICDYYGMKVSADVVNGHMIIRIVANTI